jgi:predicted amidophosphoribosyltransferase
MRICAVCSQWCEGSLCGSCRRGLHPADPAWLDAGLEVFAPYLHLGTARKLVHRLKYTGMRQAAKLLAAAMVKAMPADVTALVPVPRAMVRRAHYGVDPAVVLAELVGRQAQIPVLPGLRAPVWWPANAGTARTRRRSPRFRVVRTVPAGSMLVDDVVTTGTTLHSAAAITGLDRALTATRAGHGVSE